MKILILVCTIIGAGFYIYDIYAKVDLKESAIKLMSGSKLVAIDKDDNEFKFETSKGTIIEIELNLDASIDEVSGKSAKNGDEFQPPNGLISLSQAIQSLEEKGKKVANEWSFEKSLRHGWIYEIQGFANETEMEFIVSAKNGELIKEEKED